MPRNEKKMIELKINEALDMIQGNTRIMVGVVDFDNDTSEMVFMDCDEVEKIIKKSGKIFTDYKIGEVVKHINIYDIRKGSDLLGRSGIMYDVILNSITGIYSL
jgi:hypothetical protein